MKTMKFFLPLPFVLALVLSITSCPSNNGHSPFDILAGRSTPEDLLADQGTSLGVFVTNTQVSLQSTISVTRGSPYTFYAGIKNATGSTLSISSSGADRIQFFYCLESAYPGSMYSTTGGATAGSFTNATAILTAYVSAGEGTTIRPVSNITIPNTLTSGQTYYVGVKINISGKTNQLAASTNVLSIQKFGKISIN